MSDAPSTSTSTTSKGSPPAPSNPLNAITIETEPSEASLTMAQLKKIAKQLPPKPKLPQHTFTYADTDTLPNELNEFFNFSEIPQSLELKDLFMKAYDDSWIKSPNSERMTYIEYLLEQLELKNMSARVHAAKLLVYIAEGTFGECTNAEQHQHWLEDNTRALRKAGALSACFQALRLSCSEHDRFNSSGPEKYNDADPLQTCKSEELCTEISYYMTVLYMCIEVSKWKDSEKIGVEISKLTPSFPEFLFGLIAGLREKNVKQFPVKKLLLLLWKVILVMFGPTSGPLYIRLKNTARALNNLPPLPDNSVGQQMTKANPIDFLTFHSETAQKYPAYHPEGHPFPVSIDNVGFLKPASQNGPLNGVGVSAQAQQPQPAPPKRQTASAQYQTNNRQPFIFPLQKFGESVPHSILEASELYERNMYVGLGIWQLYKERSRMARNHVSIDFPDNDPIPTEKVDPKAREILRNIDTLYTAILPNLQNIIVVLLKLLLSTIPNPASSAPPAVPAVPQPASDSSTGQTQPQSPAQADVMRNREITSKAVSALLLILLKYFRASHVLRFEYLCQVLVDSGCLLLVLKLLGLQDVNGVVAGNDTDGTEGQLGWFEAVRAVANQAGIPESGGNMNEDDGLIAETAETPGTSNAISPFQGPHQEGVTLLKTCWRNMFWSINFLRILQKLSKKKVHRIMLLVQYKSSAILKRILKISQPLLELYTLKVLKSQIPYLGRKWRTNNMKVFTSIYMRCRPDLRDEWVGGGDIDGEVEDALGQEQNLRQLVRFFHDRIYPGVLPPLAPNSLEKQDDTALNGSMAPANDSVEFPPPRSSMVSWEYFIYLDDTPLNEYFLSNYESWLDDEVFSEPSSPKGRSRRNSFDSLNGFDGPGYKIDHNYSDEFETHISEGWDFPNTSLAEAQDRFDALAKNIDWRTVDAKEVESRLWQSGSGGVRRLLEEPDEDDFPVREDIPLRVGPEMELY